MVEIKESLRHSIEALIDAERAMDRAYQWAGGQAKSYLDVAKTANRMAQDEFIRRLPREVRKKENLINHFPYLRIRLGGDNNEE